MAAMYACKHLLDCTRRSMQGFPAMDLPFVMLFEFSHI